jgi:hypothetical protein
MFAEEGLQHAVPHTGVGSELAGSPLPAGRSPLRPRCEPNGQRPGRHVPGAYSPPRDRALVASQHAAPFLPGLNRQVGEARRVGPTWKDGLV